MKTIIFVCHGNICRSVAAEFIFKDLLKRYQMDDRFIVYSRATSREEIGNDIYPPMKRALRNANITFEEHHATQINQEDYDKADYIFYMDKNNKNYLDYLLDDKAKKFIKITKYTENLEDIEDPWYSGEHDIVVKEITRCCEDILKNIK